MVSKKQKAQARARAKAAAKARAQAKIKASVLPDAISPIPNPSKSRETSGPDSVESWPKLIGLGVLAFGSLVAAIATAFQVAGVQDVLFAYLILEVGWLGFIGSFFLLERVLKLHRKQKTKLIIGVAVISGIAMIGVGWLMTSRIKKPEVTLRFVGPPFPVILDVITTNESDAIARDLRYNVVVWNLDSARFDRGGLGGRPPICKFVPMNGEYLGKREESQSESVFAQCPEFANSLLVGDKLVGWAFSTCADCIRSHGYWFYKEWGKQGWYAETRGGTDPGERSIVKPVIDNLTDLEQFWKTRDLLERKPMEPLRPKEP